MRSGNGKPRVVSAKALTNRKLTHEGSPEMAGRLSLRNIARDRLKERVIGFGAGASPNSEKTGEPIRLSKVALWRSEPVAVGASRNIWKAPQLCPNYFPRPLLGPGQRNRVPFARPRRGAGHAGCHGGKAWASGSGVGEPNLLAPAIFRF